MIRLALTVAAIAFATPAAAQHGAHAGHAMPAASPASQCTPEHAAMGHCTMPKPAAPQCTPEHAAMGHCTMPKPAAPQCTPEHAAMGHCTMPKPAEPALADPKCPPEHAAMGHCTPAVPAANGPPPKTGPSAAALSGPEHAADAIWGADAMAPVRRSVYTEHGQFRGSRVLIDRLEYRAGKGRDGYAWEGEAWFGGDYDRLWIKTGGEGEFGGGLESAEVQALWSHALDPWFNLQTGVRYDIRPRPDRAHLVLGIQGLAPYWFEIDVAAFLSTRGDVTARIEGEYDQRITNQLILQPRIEMELAAQDVPEIGLGAGLSSAEAGVRLRYEFVPEFAPYVGVEYERRIGKTARLARAAGEGVGGWALVTGIRAWF